MGNAHHQLIVSCRMYLVFYIFCCQAVAAKSSFVHIPTSLLLESERRLGRILWYVLSACAHLVQDMFRVVGLVVQWIRCAAVSAGLIFSLVGVQAALRFRSGGNSRDSNSFLLLRLISIA
jgi:hypothetical protein